MTVDKLSSENAFSSGAELWVLPMTQSPWWKEIDFRSGFLLSTCSLFRKKEIPAAIEEIIKETQIQKPAISVPQKSILLGSEHHFLNKWILLLPDESKESLQELGKTCDDLKVHSIRFFSTTDNTVQYAKTRLSTSLTQISFVT